MDIGIVISFLGAVVILALMPGPDNIFVLTESLLKGRIKGYAISTGLSLGIIVHTLAVATGVAVLIKSNERILFVIKIIGVCYLVYLAVKGLKEKPLSISNENLLQEKNILAVIKKGFLMNVFNPKVMLFFIAFFPQFIVPSSVPTEIQICVLGGLFMVTSFLVFSFIATMAGKITPYLNNGKFWNTLRWVRFSVLIAISVFILV